MVMARVLMLLCVAVAIVRSEEPGAGVGEDLVSSSLRQLTEEVVKVHLTVHEKEVAPVTEQEPHKKEEEAEKAAPKSSETVQDDNHGAVRIEEAADKHEMAHQEKNPTKQTQDDETVVEYKHGSVKIFGKKDIVAADNEVKSKADNAKKEAQAKEQGTANEVHEVSTKLSSTPSADKKPFHGTFGPMVIICGIIGGLAAIVGVAGLVMDHSQTMKDSSDPNDSTELDVDVDIEANVVPVGVKDDDGDSDSSSDKEDSSNDEDEEEEDAFANEKTRVSM